MTNRGEIMVHFTRVSVPVAHVLSFMGERAAALDTLRRRGLVRTVSQGVCLLIDIDDAVESNDICRSTKKPRWSASQLE